jgi:opacity protein-like surface antigen
MVKPQSPSLFVIAVFAMPFYSLAQSNYEVGINAGGYVYQGELTPLQFGSYNTLRAGLSIWASKKINQKISLRANIALGSLHGDDSMYNSPSWRQQRNLKFTTPVKEFSLLAVWNVYPHITRFSPYLFAGLGYSFIKVNRDYTGFNAAYFANDKVATDGLATDAARKTPGGLAVVPLGAGLRYALNDKFSLHAETNYRLLESDYLDGFSKVGNPSKNDHYQSTSIGLIYSFGKNKDVDCPKF